MRVAPMSTNRSGRPVRPPGVYLDVVDRAPDGDRAADLMTGVPGCASRCRRCGITSRRARVADVAGEILTGSRPPSAGKSMLATRLPALLALLKPVEGFGIRWQTQNHASAK
jgi:hypothetical protein